MSSNNKENAEGDKKKKSKSRLSIKIFSSNTKKRNNLKKINEDLKTQPNGAEEQKPAKEVKQTEEVAKVKQKEEVAKVKQAGEVAKDETDSGSDTSEEAPAVPPPSFRPAMRRRSLSACADVQDTLVKFKSKEEELEEEEEDQLSPLPTSPTKSCLRGRSATIGYSGEDVETESRPRSVSFSPETVDPPPRTVRYRAWVEARSKAPPINVKHEKHKQKMNQLKKVNMADYLASRKQASGSGLMSSSSSAFSGGSGGGMMM